jgi:hypothetical protein
MSTRSLASKIETDVKKHTFTRIHRKTKGVSSVLVLGTAVITGAPKFWADEKRLGTAGDVYIPGVRICGSVADVTEYLREIATASNISTDVYNALMGSAWTRDNHTSGTRQQILTVSASNEWGVMGESTFAESYQAEVESYKAFSLKLKESPVERQDPRALLEIVKHLKTATPSKTGAIVVGRAGVVGSPRTPGGSRVEGLAEKLAKGPHDVSAMKADGTGVKSIPAKDDISKYTSLSAVGFPNAFFKAYTSRNLPKMTQTDGVTHALMALGAQPADVQRILAQYSLSRPGF